MQETTVYGYVRVSTKEQKEDRQMIALREFMVPQEHIYMDKLSGKDFNRPQYRKLLKRLCPGSTLVIKSIDRLGRNYTEILDQWRVITREKQADIVVLDMPLLDTRSKGEDLTGRFVSDLVLQILSYVAQVERDNIRQRQAEGIAAAKARGVKFGRKRMVVPDEFPALRKKLSGWQDFCQKSGTEAGGGAQYLFEVEPNIFKRAINIHFMDLKVDFYSQREYTN